MFNCKYCNKPCKSKASKSQHEIRCKDNPNRITPPPKTQKWKDSMIGRKGTNQFIKAKELGKKFEVSESTKKKISDSNTGRKLTEEHKNNIAAGMKRAVLENPDSYTSSNRGRTKQIVIDGIKFQGQWEVDFYLWAKAQGLNPVRPIESFPYIWNGERRYHPDFYIESKDLYVEVKGYETERDRAKWSQFPKKLKVIKEKEIQQIRKGMFPGLDIE